MKLLFVLLVLSFSQSSSYKILYLFPYASHSHYNAFESVIKELARRNHSITIVTSLALPKPQEPNIHHTILRVTLNTNDVLKKIVKGYGTHSFIVFATLHYLAAPICETYLQNQRVKQLLERGVQFDIVITDSVINECPLATAPLLGKYVMMHSPSNFIPWHRHVIPRPPSYVPMNDLHFGSKMNFFERLNNFFQWEGSKLIFEHYHIPKMQRVVAKHLPRNPSIIDAFSKVSLTLTNADPVITSPRPLVPSVVNVGGTHVKKAKPLAKELEDFIESCGDKGFVYFSLGSIVQSKYLPEEMKRGMLSAFSRLEQNVIWKYEENLENLPKNVKIVNWLPQQDLLAHSKIRLFITHGGMLSLQESAFYGVPLVAIPVFADQPGNVARIVEIGIGLKLELTNISETSMFEVVSRVLNDKRYAENAKKYSVIFRDSLNGLVENAVDSIENVVKYNGTAHLQCAGQELNVFQYFLIDITVFVLVVSSLVVICLMKIVKIVVEKLSRNLNVDKKRK